MSYLDELNEALQSTKLISTARELHSHDEITEALVDAFEAKRREGSSVYFIGNGGSAGIAIHMTIDFLKNGRMRTHGMHDPAALTCFGNDYGYEHVFSERLKLVARPNDLLVAISSSGESKNILNAVSIAEQKRCGIITFSGFRENNSLSRSGELNVYVPSMKYGIVESIHNLMLQRVVDELMMRRDREG